MITYHDCPQCGARKIRSTVRLCEVCETCEKYESKIAELRRERDEAKARLKAAEEHESLAEARAFALEQERDEARAERQRIVAWIRVRLAHSTLDDRVPFRERGVMIDLANAIEQGDHDCVAGSEAK